MPFLDDPTRIRVVCAELRAAAASVSFSSASASEKTRLASDISFILHDGLKSGTKLSVVLKSLLDVVPAFENKILTEMISRSTSSTIGRQCPTCGFLVEMLQIGTSGESLSIKSLLSTIILSADTVNKHYEPCALTAALADASSKDDQIWSSFMSVLDIIDRVCQSTKRADTSSSPKDPAQMSFCPCCSPLALLWDANTDVVDHHCPGCPCAKNKERSREAGELAFKALGFADWKKLKDVKETDKEHKDYEQGSLVCFEDLDLKEFLDGTSFCGEGFTALFNSVIGLTSRGSTGDDDDDDDSSTLEHVVMSETPEPQTVEDKKVDSAAAAGEQEKTQSGKEESEEPMKTGLDAVVVPPSYPDLSNDSGEQKKEDAVESEEPSKKVTSETPPPAANVTVLPSVSPDFSLDSTKILEDYDKDPTGIGLDPKQSRPSYVCEYTNGKRKLIYKKQKVNVLLISEMKIIENYAPLSKKKKGKKSSSSTSSSASKSKDDIKKFMYDLHLDEASASYNSTTPKENNATCAACGAQITNGRMGLFSKTGYLCFFTGLYYCNRCHHGDRSVIPAKLVCYGDDNLYPVCVRARMTIQSLFYERCIPLSAVTSPRILTSPSFVAFTEACASLRQNGRKISTCDTCKEIAAPLKTSMGLRPRIVLGSSSASALSEEELKDTRTPSVSEKTLGEKTVIDRSYLIPSAAGEGEDEDEHICLADLLEAYSTGNTGEANELNSLLLEICNKFHTHVAIAHRP